MTPKTAQKAGPSPSRAIASPLCLVDVVIFTIRDGKLHVLLVRRPSGADDPFPSAWALPGGFIDVERDVSIEDTARRKLKEKTGVQTAYLEQLGPLRLPPGNDEEAGTAGILPHRPRTSAA